MGRSQPNKAAAYQKSLVRALTRTLDEGRYTFVVMDAPNTRLDEFRDVLAAAQFKSVSWRWSRHTCFYSLRVFHGALVSAVWECPKLHRVGSNYVYWLVHVVCCALGRSSLWQVAFACLMLCLFLESFRGSVNRPLRMARLQFLK
eukprot:1143820-Pelagomonas_calceolata.AAC.5